MTEAHEIEYIETDAQYLHLNTTDMETDVIDENDDHWDNDSIRLLLNMYLQNIDKFRNPKIRKKNVWMDISRAVGKGPDSCDKKFRNLKQTYMRVLKKKNRDGPMVMIRWPYFDIFEEIYSEDGEYHPEIQSKIQESTNESVAKTLLSMSTQTKHELAAHENGESSKTQSEETKRRQSRKRYAEFRKATIEMRDRQRLVEEKLDKLIHIVEESNNIQKERNRLFEQFLAKLV